MINASHEAALAVRTFTHGYDMYLPDEVQVGHLDYANYPDGKRHKVWEVKSDQWQAERTDLMVRRMQSLLYGIGDPALLGRYGLGSERTVAQWAKAAGVNLADG